VRGHAAVVCSFVGSCAVACLPAPAPSQPRAACLPMACGRPAEPDTGCHLPTPAFSPPARHRLWLLRLCSRRRGGEKGAAVRARLEAAEVEARLVASWRAGGGGGGGGGGGDGDRAAGTVVADSPAVTEPPPPPLDGNAAAGTPRGDGGRRRRGSIPDPACSEASASTAATEAPTTATGALRAEVARCGGRHVVLGGRFD
jgi:hypothetical protein